MKPKSHNHHQPELNLTPDSPLVSKSLGELDNILLEKVFLGQDAPELVFPNLKLTPTLSKALYITEIDHKFYFLDRRSDETNLQPQPIEAQNLASSQLLASPESDLPLNTDSQRTIPQWLDKSLFLGKKGLLLGLGLGVLLTVGATRLTSPPQASDRPAEVTATAIPPQAVTVAEVNTTEISNTLNATGTVRAYESTPVMSQASGLQITEVLTDRGNYVQQGQVLARLNDRALQAQQLEAQAAVTQAQASLDELREGSRTEEIAQAEARVANAQSALVDAQSNLDLVQKRVERNRNLETEGAITRDRFDEILNQEQTAQAALAGAKANLQEAQEALAQVKAGSRAQTIAQAEAQLIQAQGRLEAIEAQLSDTIIVAPTSGLVVERSATVGQIAATGDVLFSIVRDGRLELRLQIPETLIAQVQPEQKVTITSNADPNLKLIAKVREINPAIDDNSRQALVKVDLPDNTSLKPGMFLQAAINTNSDRGIAIPIAALLPQSGNQATVYVVQDDNTVSAQTIEMGEILNEQTVEIVDGLQSGDRIVLKGAAYLKDGDQVTIKSN